MAVLMLLARSLHCQLREKAIHAYSAHNSLGPWHTPVKWLLVFHCLKACLDLAKSFINFAPRVRLILVFVHSSLFLMYGWSNADIDTPFNLKRSRVLSEDDENCSFLFLGRY